MINHARSRRFLNTAQVLLAVAPLCCSVAFAVGGPIVIDSFNDGSSFTDSNTSGTASYNNITGAIGIIGGSREVRTRAGASGFYGPSAISVDVVAGTLASYGGDSGDRYLEYGSAIGSQTFTGAGPGMPLDLNLNLTLSGSVNVNVASASSGDFLGIALFSADGSTTSTILNIDSAGLYSVPLSSFPGLTAMEAAEINGILFSPESGAGSAATGLVLNDLSLTVPEPSTCDLTVLALSLGFPLWYRKYRLGK